MNIDKYLKKIQNDESLFPIDSCKKDKKKGLRVMYPEQEKVISPIAKRAMIDFDGVISRFLNGWNNGTLSDDLMPDAKEAIDEIKNLGYEIVIFTTRASKSHYKNEPSAETLVDALKIWLKKHNIYYDRITAEKLGAVFYVDDKGIRFSDWKSTMKQIRDIDKNLNMEE